MVTLLCAFAPVLSAQSSFKAPRTKQQDKTAADAAQSADKQQPTAPTKITLEGPVTVINQPDSKQEQRDTEARAQTNFTNSIQKWTLFFAGLAAAGAIGAYFANKRAADAAEAQIGILNQQIADSKEDAAEQRRIANESLAETRKTAMAAEKSADAAIAALLHNQQPLVLFEGIKNPCDLTPERKLTAVLKNYGGGAAMNTTVSITASLGALVIHHKNSTTPVTIGPDGSVNMATSQLKDFMTPGQIEAVINGAPFIIGIVVKYTGPTEQTSKAFAANYIHDSKTFHKMELTAEIIATMKENAAKAKAQQEAAKD